MMRNEAFMHELNRKLMRYNKTGDVENSPRNMRLVEESTIELNTCTWFEYILVLIVSLILLLGVLAMTLLWVTVYRNGFDTNELPLIFNAHPTFMVAGFITISGFAMLLYRFCICLTHPLVKLLHFFFQVLAIPPIIKGFLAIREAHESSQLPAMKEFDSLHSWLGLGAMTLFGLQIIFGFFTFILLSCCKDRTFKFRSIMAPLHASFGVVILMLAIMSCITGLIEMDNVNKNLPPVVVKKIMKNKVISEHYIINALGVMLVITGIVVSMAVRRLNTPATVKLDVDSIRY